MYIVHRKTTVKGSSFPLKCLVMVMNLDFSQQHELLFWNFLELLTVWTEKNFQCTTHSKASPISLKSLYLKNPQEVARSSSNLLIILSYSLMGLFEYFLCFGCTDICQPSRPENLKQSAKGYERVIWKILRRSGYFSKKSCVICRFFWHQQV